MLAQLTISNFAIVRELEIDFHSGMTAITGETGAGKSIAIDALGLCLGGRAEADMVRRGANRADLVRPLLPERHACRSALAGTEPAGKRA
jgi:DNA repair protein RecN (Recombination protein N)